MAIPEHLLARAAAAQERAANGYVMEKTVPSTKLPPKYDAHITYLDGDTEEFVNVLVWRADKYVSLSGDAEEVVIPWASLRSMLVVKR